MHHCNLCKPAIIALCLCLFVSQSASHCIVVLDELRPGYLWAWTKLSLNLELKELTLKKLPIFWSSHFKTCWQEAWCIKCKKKKDKKGQHSVQTRCGQAMFKIWVFSEVAAEPEKSAKLENIFIYVDVAGKKQLYMLIYWSEPESLCNVQN